ncbi:hypothetical protein ACFLQV_04885, partial [Calditrichota bacterium]
ALLELPRELEQIAVAQISRGLPFSVIGFQFQRGENTHFQTFLAETTALNRLSFLVATSSSRAQ